MGFAGLAACTPAENEARNGNADDADVADAEPGEAAGPETTGPRPTGMVRGIVRNARTDVPVPDALVTAGELATSTDDRGGFVLSLVPEGGVSLRTSLRGFRVDSTTVEVEAGESTAANVALAPAEPPCCELAGEWAAEFALDSAGLNAAPRARDLSGRMRFEPSARTTDRIAAAEGSSTLDFSPLLDGDLPGEVEAAAGEVFHGDSVAITLQPRFGDWAVELRGRQVADTIRGGWFQRASCCGAYGRFELVRE